MNKKTSLIIAVAVVVIAAIITVVLAVDWDGENGSADESNANPFIVGETKSVSITNDDLTDLGGSSVRSKKGFTITEPGATYLSLHFANFDFSRECNMEIRDKFGNLVVSYTDRGRRNRGTFWARHVEGDTMEIQVDCVLSVGDNKAIFQADEYAIGFAEDVLEDLGANENRTSPVPERQLRAEEMFPIHQQRGLVACTADDGLNAKCYKDSHPTEYDLSKRVSRMKIAGKGVCTGWLVGPNNMLLTNRHCIESEEELANTDFQFMAEGELCSDSKNKAVGYDTYDGVEIVMSSFDKDFTLIRLAGDPVSKYGYLEIENRLPDVQEIIFIPGHPKGRAKQIALEDSYSDLNGGRCAILDVGKDSCGYSYRYDTLQYTCDTLGGNSGSPIISVETGKVVGLHHCGALNCDYGNLAVPMFGEGIYNDIIDLIASEEPETSSPTTSPTATPTTRPTPMANVPQTTPPTANPTAEFTAQCFSPKMKIEIQLDDYAAETRWELWQTDPSQMISSGSNYPNNEKIVEEHCLADDGIHYLKFFDEFGDGFCCGKGFGYYKVWYNEWLIYHNNGDIGGEIEVEISPEQVCQGIPIHLTIETDNFGIETEWELVDASGTIVHSGGPYPGLPSLIEDQLCVYDIFGTYTFTMRDTFGDGMRNAGGGTFKLARDGEEKFANNGEFDDFITYSIPPTGLGQIVDGS